MRGRRALAAICLVLAACGSKGSGSSTKSIRLGMVPKGSTHEHWKRVHAGAEKAARELTAAGTPVEVLWKSPIREDDREQQVEVVEGFISQGVSGLVLAP